MIWRKIAVMDFLAELIANILLAAGIFVFQWCARHKNATWTILAAALVIVDLFVLIKYVW